MHDDTSLLDLFQAIEGKHGGTPGSNADQAWALLTRRANELAGGSDVQEFHCTMQNDWDAALFHALLKRYGIKPYRYRKQRKSTVLVRVSKCFMDDHLWPIFNGVRAELHKRFMQLTTALLPSISPGPYSMAILDHEHEAGQLCETCRQRLAGSASERVGADGGLL